jgi:hypothetical protein
MHTVEQRKVHRKETGLPAEARKGALHASCHHARTKEANGAGKIRTGGNRTGKRENRLAGPSRGDAGLGLSRFYHVLGVDPVFATATPLLIWLNLKKKSGAPGET